MGGKPVAERAEAPHVPPATQISPVMLFVKPSMWVGLATQTSLLSTTITMLVAPLGFLMTIGFYVLNASVISVYVGELFSTKYRFRGAGISQGAGKLVNVAMPFAVTWLLANLQPSVIYFAIVGIALVAAIVVIAVGPETRAKRLG